MDRRTSGRIAWLTWGIAATLPVALVALSASADVPISTEDVALSVAFFALQLAFSTVGALLASRRPHNPIGWLFCSEGLALSIAGASDGYALLRAEGAGALPAAEVSAWIASWSQGALLVGPFVFLFLLFPDGRLASTRWRPVARLAAAALVVSTLATALRPGPLESYRSVTNPLGVEILGPTLNLLFEPSFILLLGALIASAVSLVLRLRRARGRERQQLKWFASAGACLGIAFIIGPITWAFPSFPEAFWPVLFVLALATVPISAGIAILRYRLYDIDRIINKTIVYALVTASLVAAYAGMVFVVSTFAIGTSDSLTVAIATLAVAALFRPSLSRAQRIVDRSFFRSKYNSQTTVDEFSSRLCQETDIEYVTADLIGVVRATMQPSHISVWLNEPEPGK
jgi:hypothetical protein